MKKVVYNIVYYYYKNDWYDMKNIFLALYVQYVIQYLSDDKAEMIWR